MRDRSMGEDSAILELIRRASDPGASLESLAEAIARTHSRVSPDDRAGGEVIVRRLAEEVIDAPTRPDMAGTVALYCGALVESGLDPTIAIGPILNRLGHGTANEAIAYVRACRQAADDEPASSPIEGGEPESGRGERDDPVERHGERVAEWMPTEAKSFRSLGSFSMAAVAMLARSIESRKASWSRIALRASLDELGGQYGHAGLLWMMMQVLDDEPIVVLHPARGKGYRVRISGLGDNFQLHTLLADELIGRFSSRWLRGRRPTRAEAAAARDGSIREHSPPARGSFNLWTWRGLKPDGTLLDTISGSAHWIWSEGVPADIPSFEGTRVVLLGPPPYERAWTATRKFPAMAGSLAVESILTADETRRTLARIASIATAQ